ncbi:DsrE/DsrF/DrsH-like family protein [Mycoplasmatota bacterium]|nr:DsrE/DsrF/DrsH-like family protein [Mycoplasmatota bacterium]
MNKKTIIIGGVAGGASTATRLRRLDEKREIIMLERGEYISFANCGLPYYIGDIIQSRDALLVETVEDMEARFNIDVRIFSEAISIDAKNKLLTIKNIKSNEVYTESYDDLVISTGAFPVKPPIPGIKEAKNLYTLRNIPDMDQIKAYINESKPKNAAVIGGGFIGIEMAENLHHLGLNVTIVEMADQVMGPVDIEMAEIVHQHIRDKNVDLILSDGVKAFKDQGKNIELNSGKIIDTDLIIFSIGVRPENIIAKEAGLKLGKFGGIEVNDHLQTSDPSIYAIGDVIEVKDFVTKDQVMIPLAGPANKQGRIVADNLTGNKTLYSGSMGTSVAKVFDYTVGSTGNNEKTLIRKNIKYKSIHIHPGSHAGYYPGSTSIAMKLLFDPETEKIFGAQAIGMDGVDKRIDVLATAIRANLKVTQLKDLELSYAPPFSSAKDPVNMLGFVAENIINHLVKTVQWNDINDLIDNQSFILDVRDEIEYQLGKIPTSVNIPLPELRDRLSELPFDKKIYVYCQTGIRAYNAYRILSQNNFDVYNLDGAFRTYQCVFNPGDLKACQDVDDSGTMMIDESDTQEILNSEPTLKVNAIGLQCPGPIVKAYKSLETLKDGDILEISASDPGFEKDVTTWSKNGGHKLLNINKDGNNIIASIQKGSAHKAMPTSTSVKDGTTIVVFSQDLDKALAAFIIAQGAKAMGKDVSLFFTFWGLNILRKPKKQRIKKSFLEKMFGKMMPRGTKKLPISKMNMGGMGPKMMKHIMKKKSVDSLELMIEKAKELDIKLTACAMSMDILGIKKEELIDGIEIAGVATYLGDTTDANHNLFI